MRYFPVFLVIASLIPAASQAAMRPATAQQAKPAVSRQSTDDFACMDHHLLSRAAYHPTMAESVKRCGHLLSTDTLLTIHHWTGA